MTPICTKIGIKVLLESFYRFEISFSISSYCCYLSWHLRKIIVYIIAIFLFNCLLVTTSSRSFFLASRNQSTLSVPFIFSLLLSNPPPSLHFSSPFPCARCAFLSQLYNGGAGGDTQNFIVETKTSTLQAPSAPDRQPSVGTTGDSFVCRD